MNLAHIVQDCKDFISRLNNYAPLFNSSLMQDYPHSLGHFPSDFTVLEADLAALNAFCQNIAQAPIADYVKYGDENTVKVQQRSNISKKKNHELDALLALLSQHTHDQDPALPIIDWGGGKGHLAAKVQAQTQHPVLVLDKQRDLLSHYQDLDYLEASIEQDQELPPRLKQLLSEAHGSLGLHACGSLSIRQMENAANSHCQWLINVPCCFEKMQEAHRPLSLTLAHLPPLSPAALNLATRTSKNESEDNIALKKSIHDFRWTIFLFEYQELVKQQKLPRPTKKLGRFKPAQYQEGFAKFLDAVLDKAPHLSDYKNEIILFHESEACQAQLNQTHHLQNWRNQFARPLELAVVLDRGFWLFEQGFEVNVERLFDSKISPRNFTLRARRLLPSKGESISL